VVVTRVLVVDDESNIVRIVSAYLSREGFEVVTAADGAAALRAATAQQPDLVVLDLMLPEVDGLEVCRQLRRDSDVPVLMLTARADDVDKVVGLSLGADDYLTKPFNPAELVARVKAILRRAAPVSQRRLQVGPVVLDLEARSARNDGKELELTYTEFEILRALLERPDAHGAGSSCWNGRAMGPRFPASVTSGWWTSTSPICARSSRTAAAQRR
jgi:two-component system alkaline phosphatase synthesis response regulator PhoP